MALINIAEVGKKPVIVQRPALPRPQSQNYPGPFGTVTMIYEDDPCT